MSVIKYISKRVSADIIVLLGALVLLLGTASTYAATSVQDTVTNLPAQVINAERSRILEKAQDYLSQIPSTVVDYHSPRSSGNVHEFYSEGDYWWPDPDNPDGPYIRKDGLSNPDNFIQHRLQLIALSDLVGTLASAHLLEPDAKYLRQIDTHLNAWFVNESTKMAPHLKYAQAIKGRNTGRSIGIIDTIHLTEVARSIYQLEKLAPGSLASAPETKQWFAQYLQWLVTSDFGQAERQHPNNHGVCWAMQASAFAQLVGNNSLLEDIRDDFKEVFIKKMMARDGSFPAELARTKPYGYSLFVLDAMATTATIISTREDNLWRYTTSDGRGMRRAIDYMLPYIQNKSSWPLPPDVLHWNDWPVRQPALLFAALEFDKKQYYTTWKDEERDPKEYEVLRNLPVRHPLIWLK